MYLVQLHGGERFAALATWICEHGCVVAGTSQNGIRLGGASNNLDLIHPSNAPSWQSQSLLWGLAIQTPAIEHMGAYPYGSWCTRSLHLQFRRHCKRRHNTAHSAYSLSYPAGCKKRNVEHRHHANFAVDADLNMR